MSTAIPTRGLWRVHIPSSNENVATIVDDRGYTLAQLKCSQISIIQNIDNALLMAAAPTLATACQQALLYLENGNDPTHERSKLILTKAIKKTYGL